VISSLQHTTTYMKYVTFHKMLQQPGHLLQTEI